MPPVPAKSPVFIGLDPGGTGGLAAVWWGRAWLLPMPDDLAAVWSWLQARVDYGRRYGSGVYAVLERVGGYIGGNQRGPKTEDGRDPHAQPGSAMFNFGKSAGALEMALVACGLVKDQTYHLVVPQTWQKKVGAVKKPKAGGDITPAKSKSMHKNALAELARSLYPDAKVTLATADALLMAHHCRQIHSDT